MAVARTILRPCWAGPEARPRTRSLPQDGGDDEGRGGEGEEDRPHKPAERLRLRHDRKLEASLLLGYEVQGFLQFAQRAELFFDVPELGEALLDLIGAAD